MTVLALSDSLLDDPEAIAAGDPAEMLRSVATSAAQVRRGATAAAEAGIDRLALDHRPRAVMALGVGAAGLAGDVLAASTGRTCPIPVSVCHGYTLPGWVGAADLAVAVSASGTTEETLAATEEAARRGAELVAICPADSPLADLAARARGIVIPVAMVQSSRAALWAMVTPLVALGAALRLLEVEGDVFEATAERLYGLALRCQPSSEPFLNPAKGLALGLAGSLPMVWGTTAPTGVAAARLCAQWAENAKAPALCGVLPESAHAQVSVLDGSWVGGPEDLFADPVEGGSSAPRLHLVLLREPGEHPRVAERADRVELLADQRGARVTQLQAEGGSDLERLASLIGLIDYASVYLALLTGVDPSSTPTGDLLKHAPQTGVVPR